MSIIEIIKNRSSDPLLTDQEVADELIKTLLDVGVCTPVHFNTNPWRYLVIQGNARNRLGEFMADRAAKAMNDPNEAGNATLLAKIRTKPLRAPVIIVAAAAKSDNPKALMVEDIASVNAGCQNILLAAKELGLSAMWRTGSMTYDKDVVEYLGFSKATQLVAFIYLGYPMRKDQVKKREPSTAYSRWMYD